MRLGLFGGTFNPIHCGHLRSAEEVREAFALDRIYFVPAAQPPHKEGSDIAPAAHRLRMVELAVADNPFFLPSAVELDRSGPSYTVDTLRSFLSAFQRATLYFIVGLDAFCELHTWKNHFTLPELCNFIVTSRPGIPTPPPQALLPVAFQPVFWYDFARNVHRHFSTNHTVVLYEIEGLNISASAIRDKIRQGKSVRYLIPPSVGSYIAQHSLYHPERLTR